MNAGAGYARAIGRTAQQKGRNDKEIYLSFRDYVC